MIIIIFFFFCFFFLPFYCPPKRICISFGIAVGVNVAYDIITFGFLHGE